MILSFVLLVLLGGFVLFGFWFGFIHALGSLIGAVFGAFAAGRLYEQLAGWIYQGTGWDQNLLRVVSFLIIFIVLNRLIGFVFFLIERTFKFLAIIPFLSSIDHLLGGLLGFLEGVVVLGLTLYVASRFPVSPLADAVMQSGTARWLMQTVSALVPLLPKTISGVISI